MSNVIYFSKKILENEQNSERLKTFLKDDETLVTVDSDELFFVAVVESLLNLMHCVLMVSSVGLKTEMRLVFATIFQSQLSFHDIFPQF